jgi:hypothetical protein
MSWTNQTAPTGALLAQRSLTGRAVQSASPSMFGVEAPTAAALRMRLGHDYSLHRDAPTRVLTGPGALARGR